MFLYVLWTLILLLLGFKTEGAWGKALLVCLFGLVHAGFWIINCPYIGGGSFDPGGISYANYILEHSGKFPIGDPDWGYFEFPATSIICAAVSEICGVHVFTASRLVLICVCLLVPLSIYVCYARSLEDSRMAFLGVLLVLLGSVHVALALSFFRPGTMGIALFVGLLVLLSMRRSRIGGPEGGTLAWKILVVLVFVMVVMTHFITGAACLLILLGIYFYQRLNRRQFVGLGVIIPATIFCLVWWFFQSTGTTEFVITSFAAILDGVSNIVPNIAIRKGEAFLGGEVPIWASGLRLFWLGLIYVIPLFIAVVGYAGLVALRRRDAVLRWEKGALLGVGALFVAMTVADMGGNRASSEFLLFSTFFVGLLLMWFLNEPPHRFRKWLPGMVPILLGGVILALAAPTFFVHHPSVNTQVFYDTEHQPFVFLQSSHGSGDGLHVFADTDTGYLKPYYLPEADYDPFPYPPEHVIDEDDLRGEVRRYMRAFEEGEGSSLFVFNVQRLSHRADLLLGVPATDPIWQEVAQDLESQHKIYDNGFDSVVATQEAR